MKLDRRLLCLLALPLIVGCQPTIDLDTDKLLAVEAPVKSAQTAAPAPRPNPNPGVPGAPNRGPATTPEPGGGDSAPGKSDEPNWDLREGDLLALAQEKFKQAASDEKIPIVLKDGRSREGYFVSVGPDKQKITFRVPTGKDGGEATYALERAQLAPETLRRVFADEAALAWTKLKLDEEKKAYEESKKATAGIPAPAAPKTTSPTSPAPNHPNGSPAPSSSSPRAPAPRNRPPTDPCRRSNYWLKQNIINPDSIKILKWGTLRKDPRGEGLQIDVVFSSDAGGTLGVITETKRFFMKDNGTIKKAINVK